MGRSKKIIVTFAFGIGLALFCTASSLPEDPTTPPEVVLATSVTPALPEPVKETPSGDAQVKDPGVLETYGPPGTMITVVLGGLGLIMKTWKEARQIDVDGAKARATEAEERMNIEIGKAHKRIEDAEAECRETNGELDKARDDLAERKAYFQTQIIKREEEHRREIEKVLSELSSAQATLLVEIHTRYDREKLLAENGISVPNTPPPYTEDMKNSVTVSDHEIARERLATNELPQVNTEA